MNVKFKLPEGVQYTENEQKAMMALADFTTELFAEYANGKKTQEQMTKSISDRLDGIGFNENTLKSLKDSLKEQGALLNELKEKANAGGVNLTGLKGAFEKEFDSLKEAIKSQKQGFRIKGIDGEDPDLTQVTASTVTTTTGAILQEKIGIDPNLYLKRRDRQYLHDIANVSQVPEIPETYTFYEEGDEEGNIAIVEENGLKPQVHLSLVKNQVNAQKAAGYIVVTEELMKFRPRVWAAIQRLFRDKVYREYEDLLTTQMLTGANSYVATPLDGTIASPTDFDAIIAAILQGEMLNFQYDTLVINPADKWRLAMTQTNNGMFVLPYIQQGGQFGLLGLRVITTNKVDAGTFLIGEAGTWNIEEETPSIRTGLVNDDLIHNRMTIIGEIFFLSYVPSVNAGAWISGDFADIKETLATV